MTTRESCVEFDAARFRCADEDIGDPARGDRNSAMGQRRQRNEGQKRDERDRRQKDAAAAVGHEVNLVANLAQRDGHRRSASVGSVGSVRVG